LSCLKQPINPYKSRKDSSAYCFSTLIPNMPFFLHTSYLFLKFVSFLHFHFCYQHTSIFGAEMSSKISCLFHSMALLGGSENFKRWDIMRGLQATEDMPLKWIVEPWLQFSYFFHILLWGKQLSYHRHKTKEPMNHRLKTPNLWAIQIFFLCKLIVSVCHSDR
jgi:hypothetical protein